MQEILIVRSVERLKKFYNMGAAIMLSREIEILVDILKEYYDSARNTG